MAELMQFTEECLICYKSYSTEEKFIQYVGNNINNLNEFDWDYISTRYELTENFIAKFQDKVNWYLISAYQTLSEQFIKRFQDKVDWDLVSMNQILSESFIERFQDKVNWGWISTNQILSESFIERFQDKVNWSYVSQFQTLSEDFIKRFQDKVDWEWISKHQQLSKSFIEKVLVKLNNPKFNSKYYIEKYTEEIKYDIEVVIKRNKHSQQYKKHIMTILQEDKLNLNEKFKSELFTLILSET